jgi:hypothetical protein
VDPLAELRDITLPLQPDWWPPAPGWWLLLLLAVFVLFRLFRRLRQLVDKKRPFKQAHSAIAEHHQAFTANTLRADEYIEQLNQLLKRVSLYATSDFAAAPLSGDSWLAYLDEISQSTEFSSGPGKVLGNERYKKDTENDLSGLHTQVSRVVRVLEKSA